MNARVFPALTESEWTFCFYIPYIEFRNADGEPLGNAVLWLGLAIAASVALLWPLLKNEE